MHRLWVPLGTAITAVALAFSTVQVVSLLAHEIEVVHETVPATGVTAVLVDVSDGRVEVVGDDVTEATVDAEVHHGLRRTPFRVEVVDGVLEVRGGCPFPSQWCDVHPRVVVPRGVDVTVETGNGGVVVRDVDGHVDVRSGNGAVTLARIGGDVELLTHNGPIEATGLRAGTVTVVTHNGDAELAFAGSPAAVTALSHNGDIEIVLPDEEGVAYDVEAHTDDGLPDVAVRTDPTSSRSVDVASDNGDVTVRYP